MGTSENSRMETYIPLESDEDCGLSSLEVPAITKMYQEPKTGGIAIRLVGESTDRDMDDFVEVYPDLYEQVAEYLYDYYEL